MTETEEGRTLGLCVGRALRKLRVKDHIERQVKSAKADVAESRESALKSLWTDLSDLLGAVTSI
ncbi:hypothetical protein BD626DRAFT_528026, partial [Schizophyllum amplum]